MVVARGSRSSALVRPELLRWARESTHVDLATAAKAAGIKKPAILEAAETGTGTITFRQLERLARYLRLPLRVFYLSAPPIVEDLPLDFRSSEVREQSAVSPQLVKSLRTVRARADAFLDLQADLGISRPRIPNVSSPTEMLEVLVPLACSIRWDNGKTIDPEATDALNLTKEFVEHALPVLIFEVPDIAPGVQGCSLYSENLSIIILASKHSPNAKRFTLIHELVHLLMRVSGLCSPLLPAGLERRERECNMIAGEAMAPASEVSRILESQPSLGTDAIVDRTRKRFCLSHSAAAVRLNQLGRLSDSETWSLLQRYRKSWDDKKLAEAANEGGPHAYLVQAHRLGPTFTNAVLSGFDNDLLSVSQATDLLGISPSYRSLAELRSKSVSVFG